MLPLLRRILEPPLSAVEALQAWKRAEGTRRGHTLAQRSPPPTRWPPQTYCPCASCRLCGPSARPACRRWGGGRTRCRRTCAGGGDKQPSGPPVSHRGWGLRWGSHSPPTPQQQRLILGDVVGQKVGDASFLEGNKGGCVSACVPPPPAAPRGSLSPICPAGNQPLSPALSPR